jgi:hypothetical protein
MGVVSKRGKRGGYWVAVLLAGMLVGSVLLTPVGAHLNSPLTFGHLKKHFFTKKGADARFLNVGEKASDSDKLDGKDSADFLGTTGKATDADKLDNLDSAAFQKSGCVNGNVLGYAFIDSSLGATYEDIPTSFTCVSGFTVRAKQTPANEYTIDFGFNGIILASPCSNHIPLVTPTDVTSAFRASNASESGGILLVSDCVVKVFTVAATSFNVVIFREA